MRRPSRRGGGAGLVLRTELDEPRTDSVHSHLDRTAEAIQTAANRSLKAAGIGQRNRRRFRHAYDTGSPTREGVRAARG